MHLAEDIKQLVSQYGNSIVEDTRLVGMLMDMQSFKDFPAIRSIIKYIITNDYSQRIIASNDASKLQIINEIAYKSGYDKEHIKYVVNSIIFGVRNDITKPVSPNSNNNKNRKTRKWIWLSIIIGLCLLGLGFWFFSNRTTVLFRVQENGKYGFIDSIGNVIIKPQYSYVGNFTKSGYACVISSVKYKHGKSDKTNALISLMPQDTLIVRYGYIDQKNNLVVDTTNTLIIPYHLFNYFELNENRAQEFCENFNNNTLEFREYIFHELSCNCDRFIFQDSESGLFGYKNINNQIIIPPKYEYCKEFFNDVAFVAESPKFQEYSDSTYTNSLTENLNCFSLIDVSGNVIKSKSWAFVQSFMSDFTWVKTIKIDQDENGEYGFAGDCFQIDKKGNVIIGPIGGSAQSLVYNNSSKDELYVYYFPPTIIDGEKYSFLNKDGKFITDYDSDGMISIWSEDKDTEVFDDVTRFGNGYAGVRVYQTKEKEIIPRWAFIDTQCKLISEEVYDTIVPFSEGLSPVQQCNDIKGFGLWGVLDTSFNVVVSYKFNTIGNYRHGLAYAMIWGATTDREGYINRKGEFVWSTTRKK